MRKFAFCLFPYYWLIYCLFILLFVFLCFCFFIIINFAFVKLTEREGEREREREREEGETVGLHVFLIPYLFSQMITVSKMKTDIHEYINENRRLSEF